MADGYFSFDFLGSAGQRPARISRRALGYLMETDELVSSADFADFVEFNQSLLDDIGRFIEQTKGDHAGEIVTISGTAVRAFLQAQPRSKSR